jgi:hypothetical protein
MATAATRATSASSHASGGDRKDRFAASSLLSIAVATAGPAKANTMSAKAIAVARMS